MFGIRERADVGGKEEGDGTRGKRPAEISSTKGTMKESLTIFTIDVKHFFLLVDRLSSILFTVL